MISGLLAGLRNRHDADRSVGKAAGFLVAPQYAINITSSSPHCAVQLVASQFERMIRVAEAAAGPAGPGSPFGPAGPAGPAGPLSPFGPGGLLPHPARTANNAKAIRARWMCIGSSRLTICFRFRQLSCLGNVHRGATPEFLRSEAGARPQKCHAAMLIGSDECDEGQPPAPNFRRDSLLIAKGP
jgi:hypothetical protein